MISIVWNDFLLSIFSAIVVLSKILKFLFSTQLNLAGIDMHSFVDLPFLTIWFNRSFSDIILADYDSIRIMNFVTS